MNPSLVLAGFILIVGALFFLTVGALVLFTRWLERHQ